MSITYEEAVADRQKVKQQYNRHATTLAVANSTIVTLAYNACNSYILRHLTYFCSIEQKRCHCPSCRNAIAEEVLAANAIVIKAALVRAERIE